MGGQSIVYVHDIDGSFLFIGRWMVKKSLNSVYVLIEWPLKAGKFPFYSGKFF